MSDPHTAPLIRAAGLAKSYAVPGTSERVHAAHEVSFDIAPGEIVGLVGESGSGKSTVGRLLLQLERADAGTVAYGTHELGRLSRRQMRPLRKDLQIIFQDPASALNGRMRVRDIVSEPLALHFPGQGRAERARRTAALLDLVGLDASALDRYPFQFSGGQRQRISIARALACNPRLIVADEPITALDVSTQAQIINLLMQLQRDRGLALLFISHDLRMVRHLCQRVLVMLRGRIVESGLTREVCETPQHPYTRMLLSAVLDPDPDRNHLMSADPFDVSGFDCRAPGRYLPLSATHRVWQAAP